MMNLFGLRIIQSLALAFYKRVSKIVDQICRACVDLPDLMPVDRVGFFSGDASSPETGSMPSTYSRGCGMSPSPLPPVMFVCFGSACVPLLASVFGT